jgi:hypothetical protein
MTLSTMYCHCIIKTFLHQLDLATGWIISCSVFMDYNREKKRDIEKLWCFMEMGIPLKCNTAQKNYFNRRTCVHSNSSHTNLIVAEYV